MFCFLRIETLLSSEFVSPIKQEFGTNVTDGTNAVGVRSPIPSFCSPLRPKPLDSEFRFDGGCYFNYYSSHAESTSARADFLARSGQPENVNFKFGRIRLPPCRVAAVARPSRIRPQCALLLRPPPLNAGEDPRIRVPWFPKTNFPCPRRIVDAAPHQCSARGCRSLPLRGGFLPAGSCRAASLRQLGTRAEAEAEAMKFYCIISIILCCIISYYIIPRASRRGAVGPVALPHRPCLYICHDIHPSTTHLSACPSPESVPVSRFVSVPVASHSPFPPALPACVCPFAFPLSRPPALPACVSPPAEGPCIAPAAPSGAEGPHAQKLG
jgi:hypothetical protein